MNRLAKAQKNLTDNGFQPDSMCSIEGWGLAAAAVGAAGAIGGALISSNAAGNAANAQEQGAANATNAQLQMFNTTQADYKPQIALGQGAANLLSALYGTGNGGAANFSGFENAPGYKFSLQQGENAINKQAAANGGLYSSNTLGALNNYAQGTASTQYNSYVNQLLSMAGLGNAAASGVGSAATATGGEIGSNYNLAGSAAAAGTLGQANAFTNALGSNTGFGNLLSGLANGNGTPAYSSPYNPGSKFIFDSNGNIIGQGAVGGTDPATAATIAAGVG